MNSGGFEVLIVVLWDVTLCRLKSLARQLLLVFGKMEMICSSKLSGLLSELHSVTAQKTLLLYMRYGEDKSYWSQVYAEYL